MASRGLRFDRRGDVVDWLAARAAFVETLQREDLSDA